MYSVYKTDYDEDIDCGAMAREWLDDNPGMLDRLNEYMLGMMPKEVPTITASPNPVTLLLDCSGSMRGTLIFRMTAVLMALGDRMDAIGQPFEILGFTTKHWKGGQSRKDWIADGRPMTPGRLADLRHMVIKSLDTPWTDARNTPLVLLKEGLLKENIDGEALLWARSRMPDNGRLVFISDGAPIDDSTLSVNPATILEQHLNAVMADIAHDAIPMSIMACRDGHHKTKWDRDMIFTPDKDHTVESLTAALVNSINATL